MAHILSIHLNQQLPLLFVCAHLSLQKINLGFHFDVEQRARSACGWFFNFNGTAGVWRIQVCALHACSLPAHSVVCSTD
jgi:hypothetical protein